MELFDVAMKLTGINDPWYQTVEACSRERRPPPPLTRREPLERGFVRGTNDPASTGLRPWAGVLRRATLSGYSMQGRGACL